MRQAPAATRAEGDRRAKVDRLVTEIRGPGRTGRWETTRLRDPQGAGTVPDPPPLPEPYIGDTNRSASLGVDVQAVEDLIKGSLFANQKHTDARLGEADKRQAALEKAVESQTKLLEIMAAQFEIGRARVPPEPPVVPQRRADA